MPYISNRVYKLCRNNQQLLLFIIQTSIFCNLKMKAVVLLVLVIMTLQKTVFRLNTDETLTLNVGDSLISTLGYAKATLIERGCTLQILNFKGSTYSVIGNYTSPNVTGNCKSLTIVSGQVQTESNNTYIWVGRDFSKNTILTIDDWAVIRLIGTSYIWGNNQVSSQTTITTFMTSQTYNYPTSNQDVTFVQELGSIVNERGWQFSASYGQLLIALFQNNDIKINYVYSAYKINNSLIIDFKQQTFPGVIFPNITFQPRCFQPRLYLDFKPPFLFVADPYWPIFTLYDQGRYKILQVNFNRVFQRIAWQDYQRVQARNEAHVCPPYTFQFKGNCTTSCPSPYYHEMRGVHGYCVLNCQQFTPKNDTSRICSCFSEYESVAINFMPTNCSNDSSTYPYGCFCPTVGKFFDRKISLSCVSTCPLTTFPSNGLCMECPINCLTCQIDGIYRSYLQCKVCMTGFTLTNGKCFSSCSPGLGFSIINGVCEKCSDDNCINCSQSVSVCTTCNFLYALQGNACVKKCSNTSKLANYYKFASTCLVQDSSCDDLVSNNYNSQPSLKCMSCNGSFIYMHLNKCVGSCPAGYVANSNNFCYCGKNGTITINDKCLAVPTCPLQMGWHERSSSCVSCAFGCMTCFQSTCTSCNPGYFLYIAPQGVVCRRKSPLYPCDGQFFWFQSVCILKQYSDPSYLLADCYGSISNCIACDSGSSSVCVLCDSGYFLHKNTCIKTCPSNTVSYNGQVCILTEIENCQRPYLKIQSQQIQFAYSDIAKNPSYAYYVLNGQLTSNDPVGYTPTYLNITVGTQDTTFRNTEFFRPSWTCLMCSDGFGLSNNFSTCLPCPPPCKTCYMALNNSCILINPPAPPAPPPPQPANTTCQYYIDQQTKKCVQSCGATNSQPQIIDGVLYCTLTDSTTAQKYVRIDSAIYQSSDGKKHVFFVLDQTIKTDQPINLSVLKQGSRPMVKASNNSNDSLNVQGVALQSGSFISLSDSNSENSLYIVNLTGQLSKLVAQNNLLFPSSVYGANATQSHPQFMKTWLAYIGYIMGLTIILLHVVFIGNDLIYKVDNTLILGQTIYFFSFVQLLVGKLLSQFYYGWIFTHFGFFPNFFASTIPSNYVELAAPNSFKLATLDVNIVRNAGFAMSLLIVFIGAYAFVTMMCWIIAHLFNKPDVWYPKIASNALVAGLQFLSMNIFYWACANIMYINGAENTNADFYNTSKSVSIFFMVIIIVYTLGRWFFQPIGGLYMAKRIILAAILSASYQNPNMIAPLVLAQTVFTLFRYFMEGPEKRKAKMYLLFDYFICIAVYLLLWLCLDAGVNTIIISIFMFVLIVSLAYDLSEVYLQSQNEWQVNEEEESEEGSMAKAESNEKQQEKGVQSKVQ